VYGGGINVQSSSLSMDHVISADNDVYGYGPYDYVWGTGIYSSGDTSTYDHVSVLGNSADAYGLLGGGWMFYNSSSPTVTNAIIAGNTDTFTGSGSYNQGYGAGISTYYYSVPVLVNVDIVGNKISADYSQGGGIDIDYYGGITAENVSVYGNSISGSAYGGAVYAYSSYTSGYSFKYCNFNGNTSSEFYGLSTVVGSSGNVSVSPGYSSTSGSDPATWSFTLSASSAMKNAGDPALSDADGSRSDIGAYGGPGGGSW
jgi:hypothetical protein